MDKQSIGGPNRIAMGRTIRSCTVYGTVTSVTDMSDDFVRVGIMMHTSWFRTDLRLCETFWWPVSLSLSLSLH